MKISIKQKNKILMPFDQLLAGFCFVPAYIEDSFTKNVWLKVKEGADFNAVNVATGDLKFFTDDTQIEVISSELLVTR